MHDSKRLALPFAIAGFLVVAGGAPAQTTRRVSVSSTGAQGDGISGRFGKPVISSDGQVVAFDADATNLVSGDTNGMTDVFVHDRRAGLTTRVSVSTAGAQGNGASSGPAVSADGRFVAFRSGATNLVAGDTNGATDVFVHDRATGATSRASVSSAGVQGAASSFSPSLSADGRFVAFLSDAANLVAADANGTRDVFVHDRQSGATELVSVSSAGVQANLFSAPPAISADGRFVAFGSFASTLVPGDTNGNLDVFVRDRQAATTIRVSVDSAGVQGDGLSSGAAISANGRFVAFFSESTNLVAGDTNGVRDVFVHDLETGVTTRVNVDDAGAQGNGQSSFSVHGSASVPSISGDGRYIAFDSDATNLVAGDANARRDVFVRDRVAGRTERASVNDGGAEGDDDSSDADVSADGSAVTFISLASNLVAGDTNVCGFFNRPGQCPDEFVRTRISCQSGNVNSGVGPVAQVLRVNGSAGIVVVPPLASITVSLDAAPFGPASGRYALWAWLGMQSQPATLSAQGVDVGCTMNPTPANPGAAPQPFRCLRGAAVPPGACRGVVEIPGAPAFAPWSVTRSRGLPAAVEFTLQAVLQDDGAANPLGFSVSNGVVLIVR